MTTIYELGDARLRFIIDSRHKEFVTIDFKIPQRDERAGFSVDTEELIEILEKLQTKPSKITVPADQITLPYHPITCNLCDKNEGAAL